MPDFLKDILSKADLQHLYFVLYSKTALYSCQKNLWQLHFNQNTKLSKNINLLSSAAMELLIFFHLEEVLKISFTDIFYTICK